MKIAIVTSESFTSCLLISEIVRRRREDIACIVITPSKVKGKGTIGTILTVFKTSGLKYVTYKVVFALWTSFVARLRKTGLVKHYLTPVDIAKEYGIELYYSQDCNDNNTLSFLGAKEIDILLSINVYQRLLEPILNLPKIASVNNHSGLLPKYKGMAPYLWAMAKGEDEIGLSVHHMLLKFDAGKLIKQEKLPIKPDYTVLGMCLRACERSRFLIAEAVGELDKDNNAGFEQVGEGSYFSMPTRQAISDLKKRGYKLWNFTDLMVILRSRLDNKKLYC